MSTVKQRGPRSLSFPVAVGREGGADLFAATWSHPPKLPGASWVLLRFLVTGPLIPGLRGLKDQDSWWWGGCKICPGRNQGGETVGEEPGRRLWVPHARPQSCGGSYGCFCVLSSHWGRAPRKASCLFTHTGGLQVEPISPASYRFLCDTKCLRLEWGRWMRVTLLG